MAKPDYAHRQTDRKLSQLERRISSVYQEASDSLTDTVNAYFDSFAKRDAEMKERIGTVQNGKEWTEQDYKQWRLNQIGRGERFEALRDKMAKRYTKANETAVAYVNDATPGIYSLNRNYSAYTIERVASDADFTLFDERTVKRLIAENPELMPYYPAKRAVKRGIDLAYGKKQISASVTSSILQGKSIKGIADDLQARIPAMERDSAIRTARTAVTGAQNAGRIDTYHAAEKSGIKLKKEWLATLDNRTRHAHALLDGQQASPDKPFKVDGEEIMFPGDPSAPGYLVYNCRCTLVAAVDGVDTSDALRRGEDGLLPDMTFAQWEASKRGYSASPISEINDEPVMEWRKSLQNKENIAILKAKIESGEISTTIRSQQQKKHIEGTPQFEQYKASRLAKCKTPQSILTIAEQEAQEIVNKYAGTGIVEIKKTGQVSVKIIEYCDVGEVVGRYYDNDEYHDTRRIGIFYSKLGAHVVPAPPEKEKRNG